MNLNKLNLAGAAVKLSTLIEILIDTSNPACDSFAKLTGGLGDNRAERERRANQWAYYLFALEADAWGPTGESDLS